MKYENITEAVNEETKQKTVSLWGDEVTFTPEIASEMIGDGKQLLSIMTISQRPYYWLIRIDSKINVEFDENFDIEKYVKILEEEFGRIDDNEMDSDKTNDELYPNLYWDGGSWSSIYNES